MLFVLKSLTFATLLLTVSSLPCTDKNSCSTSLPVCIIGAGPAGLSAAVRLKDKGIKTVIFDRQAEVGGKCQSWYDEKSVCIFHDKQIIQSNFCKVISSTPLAPPSSQMQLMLKLSKYSTRPKSPQSHLPWLERGRCTVTTTRMETSMPTHHFLHSSQQHFRLRFLDTSRYGLSALHPSASPTSK